MKEDLSPRMLPDGDHRCAAISQERAKVRVPSPDICFTSKRERQLAAACRCGFGPMRLLLRVNRALAFACKYVDRVLSHCLLSEHTCVYRCSVCMCVRLISQTPFTSCFWPPLVVSQQIPRRSHRYLLGKHSLYLTRFALFPDHICFMCWTQKCGRTCSHVPFIKRIQ